MRSIPLVHALVAVSLTGGLVGAQQPTAAPRALERVYRNELVPLRDPAPLLADHPEFVQPIPETSRFKAPPLVLEEHADLAVRAWRFSYNARGVVEMENRLRAERTAVIVVHPWGIDDGQGWTTPEPAGCAFQCTPAKNRLVRRHAREVINPLLKELRGKVALVVYSLPGTEDPIRRRIYRSLRARPSASDRIEGQRLLEEKLRGFRYRGEPLPSRIVVSSEQPVADYFRQFPGLDAGARFNSTGFWELPVPVLKDIEVDPEDVVAYDAEGYESLKSFLREHGVRHVLLAGYNTDMCVISTTAGYQNLRKDFNVFLVGDATVATFPAQPTPACATTAAVCFAALNLLITQSSWIRTDGGEAEEGR